MVRGEPRREVGGGPADALAQAVRGRLELAFLHFARDRPRLGHGGFAVFLRDDGLQGGGRPFPVTGRRLGEHVACVCSIESGPCERVESLQMSGRF